MEIMEERCMVERSVRGADPVNFKSGLFVMYTSKVKLCWRGVFPCIFYPESNYSFLKIEGRCMVALSA
jgi:hypothetical protein